jgi:hypothetical protein
MPKNYEISDGCCAVVAIFLCLLSVFIAWLTTKVFGMSVRAAFEQYGVIYVGFVVLVVLVLAGIAFGLLWASTETERGTDSRTQVEQETWLEVKTTTDSPSQAEQEARAIPPNVRQAVLDRDDYLCRYCGRRSQTMEIDHIIPVSQGGESTLDNLVTACRRCNRKKAARTPEEAGMTVLPVRTETRR